MLFPCRGINLSASDWMSGLALAKLMLLQSVTKVQQLTRIIAFILSIWCIIFPSIFRSSTIHKCVSLRPNFIS